jgi:uncharacterized protein (TIGR02118 family)
MLVKFHPPGKLAPCLGAKPMVSYFVRYRGSAANPSAFVAHYRDRHAAILRDLPHIQSLVLHTPVAFRDPFPVQEGGTALLAQIMFENEAALDAALQSEARKKARDDFARFGAFEGEITHEALSAEAIF